MSGATISRISGLAPSQQSTALASLVEDLGIAPNLTTSPEQKRAMSNSETNLSNLLSSPDAEFALATTASIFGLTRATVLRIAETAVPLMVTMAASNPELKKRIDATCGAALPLPTAEFYALMAASLTVRQSAMDDYRAIFGNMLDSVHREAARHAGVTDGQAKEAIAALLPALGSALVLPEGQPGDHRLKWRTSRPRDWEGKRDGQAQGAKREKDVRKAKDELRDDKKHGTDKQVRQSRQDLRDEKQDVKKARKGKK